MTPSFTSHSDTRSFTTLTRSAQARLDANLPTCPGCRLGTFGYRKVGRALRVRLTPVARQEISIDFRFGVTSCGWPKSPCPQKGRQIRWESDIHRTIKAYRGPVTIKLPAVPSQDNVFLTLIQASRFTANGYQWDTPTQLSYVHARRPGFTHCSKHYTFFLGYLCHG